MVRRKEVKGEIQIKHKDDKTNSEVKNLMVVQRRGAKAHSEPQPPLTKKRFMSLLSKAAQPVSEWSHDQESVQTSESHLSGDYSDTRKNQDKTGDTED